MSGLQVRNTNITNLKECDYEKTLEKICSVLSVYEYNYKGTPEERKCFGPTTDGWHTTFPCGSVKVEKLDPKNPKKKIVMEVPAKNTSTIEIMDVLGICLASIKQLAKNEKDHKEQIHSLVNDNNNLQERIKDLERQFSYGKGETKSSSCSQNCCNKDNLRLNNFDFQKLLEELSSFKREIEELQFKYIILQNVSKNISNMENFARIEELSNEFDQLKSQIKSSQKEFILCSCEDKLEL